MPDKSVKELSKLLMEKARETLSYIPSYIELGDYNTAINRSYYSAFYSMKAIEILDGFGSFFKLNDRLLRLGGVTLVAAHPLELAGTGDGVHALDVDAEHLFDGDLDLRLVGGLCDDERVLLIRDAVVTLLGQDGL